ncbi:putative polyketide synthase [Diaporthe ampelina]|uniref:Putative polyketide synthase n=1 Tax=Diaporthe ampelina TaxID=1214573 RepID=A0A0G2FXM7_9PEZI|nr:putative polyketide synthase [Diaporthe ampelina]
MPDRIAAADDGTCHRKLLVETAYHSHHMRAVANDYRGRLLNGENTTAATGQEAGVAFVSSVTAQAYLHRKEPYHDRLGVAFPEGTDLEPRWRHFVSLATLPWLADHVVDGLVVFPGAGYLCMAIEGVAQLVRQRFPQRSIETVAPRNVLFKRGLVVPESEQVELQLSFKPLADLELGFESTVCGAREAAGNTRDICDELGWHVDIDFMRARDLPENSSLPAAVAQISLKKHANIGLGASAELTEEVLHAVQSNDDNKVASHDFVESTPGCFEAAAAHLSDFTVRYRVLRHDKLTTEKVGALCRGEGIGSIEDTVVVILDDKPTPILFGRWLGHALADGSDSGPEPRYHRFTDSQRPLRLSPDDSAIYVDDENVYSTPLADDEVEVEVRDVVLSSKSGDTGTTTLGGLVARAGTNVTSLAMGDNVIALVPVVNDSRLRIRSSHASLFPSSVLAATSAALPLDAMAASHALRAMACLSSSTGTVLVHGPRLLQDERPSPSPDLTALVTAAAATLEYVRLSGLDIPVHDVANTIDALRMVNTGVHKKESPIGLLSYEGYTVVTRAEAEGTLALHDTSASPNLDFVLSLSSFAGIVGAGTLAAYNAGNAVQDALAHENAALDKQQSTRFLTVDLGWTEDAGFTAGDDKPQLTFEQVVAEGDADAVVDFVSRALAGQLARLMSVDVGVIDVRYLWTLILF